VHKSRREAADLQRTNLAALLEEEAAGGVESVAESSLIDQQEDVDNSDDAATQVQRISKLLKQASGVDESDGGNPEASGEAAGAVGGMIERSVGRDDGDRERSEEQVDLQDNDMESLLKVLPGLTKTEQEEQARRFLRRRF
jgi:hypothetical protein